MDFNDTAEEAAFRTEVRTWLDANATRKSDDRQRSRARNDDPQLLAQARAWQAKKAAAGFARVTWPTEFGGRGASPILQVIYQQEEQNYLVPLGFFDIGLGMCIPTMMAYATQEQLQRYVKPALYGEEIWCQLFSEPAAGSDVAGIRTKAERDGEDWLINGQKVWTSGAHYCDFGIVVTRTDPTVPKHAGLTMFFLDMKSPGVEVRPIRQISGGANFNEVFFTDVRVPDAQRLGKVGDGWKVALTTLMNERLAVGLPSGGLDTDELMALARDTELEDGPAIRNQVVRGRIADWYVQQQGLKLTRYRTLTALSKGQTPGPESSIIKIVAAPKMQDMGAFAMELMGPGRHDEGRDPAGRRLPGAMDRRRGLPHRRRHRRDSAQHRGRTRAGIAGRRARRQGRAVQQVEVGRSKNSCRQSRRHRRAEFLGLLHERRLPGALADQRLLYEAPAQAGQDGLDGAAGAGAVAAGADIECNRQAVRAVEQGVVGAVEEILQRAAHRAQVLRRAEDDRLRGQHVGGSRLQGCHDRHVDAGLAVRAAFDRLAQRPRIVRRRVRHDHQVFHATQNVSGL
jgi:acyl-CoA dehydrogenase